MTQPSYAAAQSAAERILKRLTLHSVAEESPSGHWATLPKPAELAGLIDAAFWTSLRREENYVPRITLAFVAPEQVSDAVVFANSLPLEPKGLTKVAAAVERAGLHLGVWPHEDDLRVWGISRTLPPFCLTVEVILPGLIVVKQSRSREHWEIHQYRRAPGGRDQNHRPTRRPSFPHIQPCLLPFFAWKHRWR